MKTHFTEMQHNTCAKEFEALKNCVQRKVKFHSFFLKKNLIQKLIIPIKQ